MYLKGLILKTSTKGSPGKNPLWKKSPLEKPPSVNILLDRKEIFEKCLKT